MNIDRPPIELLFSLRFQSQIRRTRPSMTQELEKTVAGAVEAYGGTVRIEHKLLSASFSRQTIGFALDMLSLLESIKKALNNVFADLYGQTCILGEKIPEEDIPALLRAFTSQRQVTGIWCCPEIKTLLESFVEFEDILVGGIVDGYAQIRSIRETETEKQKPEGSEKIYRYLKKGGKGNTVIICDGQQGEQEGLVRYCQEAAQNFPLLMIRFFPGDNAVSCFVDALTPELRSELEKQEAYQELLKLGGILFRERLRDELPEFVAAQGKQFFSLLVKLYRVSAERKKCKPFIVLENLQHASPLASFIIIELYQSLPAQECIPVYGTSAGLDKLKAWEGFFPRIVKFTPEKTESSVEYSLSLPLWEAAYCCALFYRYFPVFLLPQLLQEEGKNSYMIEKTLNLLSHIDLHDPGLIVQAEKVLGDASLAVKAVVRSRLLAWVGDGRLKPCFRFLKVLSNLGGTENANLVLDALISDITNNTYKEINKAIKDGSFADAAGKEWEEILLRIVKTQTALNNGDEIHKLAEQDSSLIDGSTALCSDTSIPPAFRIRLLSNIASYYLGTGRRGEASEAVKKAMLLAQDENQGRGLACIYRLFSLVEFSGHRLPEAIDYFTFAMEQAEKSGDLGELGIAAYYAAGVHFVFGNISKARKLAVQAQEASLAAVLPGWADKSHFLEGRLCFETGRYKDAMEIFKKLESNPLAPETEQFKQTLNAWIYRTKNYLGSTDAVHSGGGDARLFEIEAAFLLGEYKKVLKLSETDREKSKTENDFIIIEQPDWSSGFSQCEFFLFSPEDFKNRMISTFRALALGYMPGGLTHDREKAIQELRRIMRDELPETDPNDAFYFYAYYRILKETRAPEVDMNTAVSIAFKRLQKRASQIDDNETKRTFLFQHRWNSALTAAAKKHKLI